MSVETWAVIPAAGASSRMGEALGGISKVLFTPASASKPLLYYTLRSLSAAECFSGVTIASRPDDLAAIEGIAKEALPGLTVRCVAGGASRQDSVGAALNAVPGSVEFVAVHDAARPFCPSTAIRAVVTKAHQTNAAILAVPVAATLKRVEEGQVLSTIDREGVWEAQTPQVTKRSVLLQALQLAKEAKLLATDESQLLERMGISVHVVQGSSANIKLTRAEDLDFVEWMCRKTSF